MLVGILQILTAFFKLGRLTQFISHSVVVGYVSGVAITVILNQLFPFFGIQNNSGMSSLYESGLYLITHLPDIHIPTLIVGAASLAVMIVMKNGKIPGPLLALIVSSVGVYLWNNGFPLNQVFGENLFFPDEPSVVVLLEQQWVEEEALGPILLSHFSKESSLMTFFHWPLL